MLLERCSNAVEAIRPCDRLLFRLLASPVNPFPPGLQTLRRLSDIAPKMIPLRYDKLLVIAKHSLALYAPVVLKGRNS
jgi:hypothetical protein